ncbi:hypothetical protein VKT23_015550 [Stygiomarasmius scandens]|uniref:Cytochrome P450 n=1 Tax=Marasmiellus scandens TaxID=2682957 RepID=A0ABR1IX97_9AGAR
MIVLHMSDFITGFTIFFFSLLIVNWYKSKTRKYPYPPGPPASRIPIIGNILQMPSKGAWYVFRDWAKDYGDLIFLHGLGNRVLVVNNLDLAAELFEKQWSVFSNRPTFTVAGELMGLQSTVFSLMNYGHEWRERRKLINLALNTRAIQKYRSLQEDIAALLNRDLLVDPEHFFEHLYLASGRVVLSVTYGIFAENVENQYIDDAERCMDAIGKALSPGAYLADIIPPLKYLPSFVPFQKEAQSAKRLIQRNAERPYFLVKKWLSEGTAPESLAKDLLLSGNEGPEFEHRAMWVTSTMYGAGAETTFAASVTFILAMAMHQDVQKAAQEEIDRVVGKDKIPTIEDVSRLPYTMAVIKETLRWHPPVPLSLPRCTAEDSIFNGYFIPKNTVVLPNLWAISRSVIKPDQFNPERFMNEGPALEDSIPDPFEWVFGLGRRICPGQHLAKNSLIAMITSILSAFDIAPLDGQDTVPNFTTANIISHPEKFKCMIRPRSQQKKEVIETRARDVKF